MEEVYLIKNYNKIKEILKDIFKFEKGARIAIKLHMGENYNKNYIKPEIVREITNFLKKNDGKPFLFDTNVAYHSSRHATQGHLKTAKENGFNFCEIKIGERGRKVKSNGKLKEIELAADLLASDYVIVLSHFKGHCDAGFGGAIKNLGMGAVTVEQKQKMHALASPIFDKEKCVECDLCTRLCHANALSSDKKEKIKIDLGECHGCSVCIRNCPQKALSCELCYITESLAEVADSFLKNFKGKVIFINVLERVTKICDCCRESEVVCPDLGILISKDILAIEKASIDLINKKVGRNLFKEINHISPDEQIDAAEKLKLGDKDYRIIEK